MVDRIPVETIEGEDESKLEKSGHQIELSPQIYFIRRKRNRKIMVAQIGTGEPARSKLQLPYIMANGSAHLSYFLIFLSSYENISVATLLFSRISHPYKKFQLLNPDHLIICHDGDKEEKFEKSLEERRI